MKRHVTVTLVFVLIGAAAALYLGCASPQNTANNNSVAMASPEPTPDKAAIQAELLRIENDWPRIWKERDDAAIRKIEADDVVLVYPDGSPGNKDQDLKDIESGALTADSWEIADVVVNVLDNDAAVVSLRMTVKGGKYKLPDGKSQDISGQYRSIDTFVRRNGQWQLAASASVPVRSPGPAAMPSATVKPSPSPRATPAAKSSPKSATSPAKAATP